MSLTSILHGISPFSELEPAVFAELAARSTRRRFARGVTLYHQGDPSRAVYVVLSGYVELQVTTPAGTIQLVARRGPRELFGEISAIDGRERMTDAVTASPCELGLIDGRDLAAAIDRSPRFARKVLVGLAGQIRRMVLWQTRGDGENALERVSALLLEAMEVYGTEEAAGGKRLNVYLTQQEIAERIGVKRECVNRKLSSLKRLGAIRFEGRTLVVLNESRLRSFLPGSASK